VSSTPPSGTDSRKPLSFPLTIVLVLLALIGNAVLIFYPRPALTPDKSPAVANAPVTAPVAAPATAPAATQAATPALTPTPAPAPVVTPAPVVVAPAAAPAPTPVAAAPASAPSPELLSKGEGVFKMRCAICHLVDRRLVGPPLQEVAPLYKDNPAGIVAWTKAPSPTPKRPGYPPMIPIFGVPDDELMAVAEYVLHIGAAPAQPTQPVGQVPVQPTPIPEDVAPTEPLFHSGLSLALQLQSGGPIDVRSARVPSLYVPEGQSVSPFLPVGPFTATFTGAINKDVWDFVTFSAEGTGSLTLKFGDKEKGEKTVLDIPMGNLAEGKPGKIKVNKGANHFTLVYKSPEKGPAQLRLFWTASEIPSEPLPATLFTHNIHQPDYHAGAKQQLGRELIGTMRCTQCHQAEAKADTGMPELAIDAPDLRAIGGRLNQPWMAAWIKDPKAMRTHATMPKLIHGEGKSAADIDKEAGAMAAYLASLGKADDATIANDEATRGKGGHLYVDLGCVSCHSANGDKPAHIDLSYVSEKFKPSALVAFLKKPEQHYKWIRMPNFALNDNQATQLAAYLLHTFNKKLENPITAGDASLGKVLMAGSGCANCHQVEGMAPIVAPKLTEVSGDKRSRGCLASDSSARGRAPDFSFDKTQLSALRAFLNTDHKSLTVQDPIGFAERRTNALNCVACHQRDNVLSTYSGMDKVIASLHATLPAKPPQPKVGEGGHEGAASDNPPPLLTFVGDKLRPEWMGKFIAGKIPYRPRPWLKMKMPAFAAGADLFAQGLSMSHGLPPITPPDSPSSGPTAEDGKKLISTDGGFNCIQCHDVGSAPAIAIFEAPGINLGYLNQRLQKDFYFRWMLNPLRFEPTTRMPKFAQDGGTTPLTGILDGNAQQQFEAIYEYLNEVAKQKDFVH
jgi:mono/diheme cytochrome c family protein